MGESIVMKSIDEYLESILQINKKHGTKLLFRGQSRHYDTLYPSIFRASNLAKASTETEDIINLINRYYKNISISDPNTISEFLIEMQQKGTIPTRLLDITSNPLVALFNAVSEHDNEDGVVYIFINGIDYFSESGISQNKKNNLYLLAKSVSALKDVYLRLTTNAITEHDVLYCFMDTFKSLDPYSGYSLPNYPMRELDEIGTMFPELYSNELFRKIIEPIHQEEQTKAVHRLFLNLFGLPLHIIPHFNAHEQIVANRIIMQGSSFLLWPNKVIGDKMFINNFEGPKYVNRLVKIFIPAELKVSLREKVNQIYNINQFYIDTMVNKY